MNKDIIKLLIAEYQRDVAGVSLIERPYFIEDALNYVFVGLRRSGKSFLMYQQIQRFLKEGHDISEILYFNFEDDRIGSITIQDLDLIKICYEEMYDTTPMFFLDEIQIVPGWQKFARRLADKGFRVFITGSNANMFSTEIATTLGGRYMIHNVYPFSFEEHLVASSVDIADKNAIFRSQTKIIKNFESFFYYGGLPELMNVSSKRAWLSNLYQKLFYGDLVSRYQIRNDAALRVLVRKLAESVKQPSSFNRLANVVSSSNKKISTDTVIDYLNHLKDSCMVFSVENYAAKLAEKESNKKYYFIDNGMLTLILVDPRASLLENMVAIQLKRLYGNGFYFYQNQTEVDFYIPEKKCAIQVCYSLADIETKNREVKALIQLSKRIETDTLMIITKDEEDIIIEGEKRVVVLPIWMWLMEALQRRD